MKRILLTSFLSVLAGFALAQNTNPWPSTGNVGIGTGSSASPAHPLEVAGGSTMSAGWNKTMMLTASFPVQIFNSAGIKWGGIGYDHSTSMRFWVNSVNDDLSGNGLLAMTILNNGNVGIGESNPLDKIHIYGSDAGARITGSSRARLNFATPTYSGWQLEVGEANGNQGAGDLGFTEAGVAAGRLVLKRGGNVLIGKTTQSNPSYKLDVAGTVRADEIVVNTDGADFVFEEGYQVRKLEEVESFIKANKHLPDIPPAKTMQEEGVGLSELQTKLLQKIEELTLYLIELDKKSKAQDEKIAAQEKEIMLLKSKQP